MGNIAVYRGKLNVFVDIAFRGAAKTARTKLFLAFCIANDTDHSRKYIKVLSADLDNAKQIVTDIYNMFTVSAVRLMYPDIFRKTSAKREETMGSFTTSTKIKVIADSVGTDQRGAIQEEARPDLILYEDFETRKTLRSMRVTKAIWDNMEEAKTGLAKNGGGIYNCNYISEAGNVHKLVKKVGEGRKVLIVPIRKNGKSTWPERYSEAMIDQMKRDDDDFEGERMCRPSASKDALFNRKRLDLMPRLEPIRDSAGFKIYAEYDPSHRYGSGHDVSGGVGLDSSASTFIDFSAFPAQVVATFDRNTIKPETFGGEIRRETEMFGGNIAGIEINNHGHLTIYTAKTLGVKLYETQKSKTRVDEQEATEYGWNTNTLTKPKMIFDLVKAVDDGLIELNDPDLIAEAESYTRNDLIERSTHDPRLVTRHFDKLMSAAIAWQMNQFATSAVIKLIESNDMAARIAANRRSQKSMK